MSEAENAEPATARALLALVRRETAAVLDDPATPVTPGASFRELGLDSLLAARLHARLTEALGRELPVTLAYDHPTPAALARWLAGGDDAPTRAPDADAADDDAADPVVVVGVGCRYPGGVDSPEALW